MGNILTWEENKNRALKKADKKENYWKGSYTVEAAAVMSLTFLVLATLIIVTFYVHDRAVLQCMVCEIPAEGRNYALEKDREKAITSAKLNITASRLLGSRDLSGSASEEGSKVSASWNAVYPVPGFTGGFLTGNELDIQVSWESKIANPSKTVRKIRGAGKLLTDAKELFTN